MKTLFLSGMFHITHPTSSLRGGGGIPPGAFMIDSAARANDRPVLVDKKPVSANDMAEEWGQLQSERAPLVLSTKPSGVCLPVPLPPDTCHLETHPSCHIARPVMVSYWFLDSKLRDERSARASFLAAADGNQLFEFSWHSNTSSVLRVTNYLTSDIVWQKNLQRFNHFLLTEKRKRGFMVCLSHNYCARNSKPFEGI